jgi:hypothetical protein
VGGAGCAAAVTASNAAPRFGAMDVMRSFMVCAP